MSHEARIEAEKIFIGSYFSNKHYIHPMLSKHSFMQWCEQQAFRPTNRISFCNGLSRFSGLYFAVVALGAINASPHETALLDHYCRYPGLWQRPTNCSNYSAVSCRLLLWRCKKDAW
ncbi:hypothetical protein BJY00DRAFT_124759 [Aspergillus carlsbadensis]|nr:hypothetical protein BJY00DRAFT_124759 [Aspergillus carlsbadensis]